MYTEAGMNTGAYRVQTRIYVELLADCWRFQTKYIRCSGLHRDWSITKISKLEENPFTSSVNIFPEARVGQANFLL
jgi:hypothetical protein